MLPREIYDAIHNSPTKFAMILAGGGFGVLGTISKFGGSSASVIDAYVTQDVQKTQEILGGKVDKLVSAEVARKLAALSYKNASHMCDVPLGIASTCVLQRVPSERPGRLHGYYVSIQTPDEMIEYTLEYIGDEYFDGLSPERIREVEEQIAERMILNAILEGSGLDYRVSLFMKSDYADNVNVDLDEKVVVRRSTIQNKLPGIINYLRTDYNPGNEPVYVVNVGRNGFSATVVDDITEIDEFRMNNCTLFSGSFNPIHKGHLDTFKAHKESTAFKVYKDVVGYLPAIFEMSLANVDKAPVDLINLQERLAYMHDVISNDPDMPDRVSILLTQSPKFEDKLNLFKNSDYRVGFLVGYDTYERLFDQKYYRSPEAMNYFIETLEKSAELHVTDRVINGELKFVDTLNHSIPTFPIKVGSGISSSNLRANGHSYDDVFNIIESPPETTRQMAP